MLLLAVAAGAIAAALLAFARPGVIPELPHFVVYVAAAIGAVAVGLADTAPTGWEPFDLLLRVAFGALVPLAAARAGSFSVGWLMVVATATVLIAVDAPVPTVTALATGLFLGMAAAGIATPSVAALAAAAAIGPTAHADWPLATGVTAAAMAVATIPVLLVGVSRAPGGVRKAAIAGLSVAVVVGFVGAAAGGFAALDARTDVDAAVDLATEGIDLLGDEDDEARTRLRDAAAHFGDAEDTLNAWWAKPALLVPGVAQQSRAVSTMASAGGDLALTAAQASEDADVDSIRPRNGQVDLAALEALVEPLDRSLQALRSADERLEDIETPLLVPPVADRLVDLREQVGDAFDSAELAAHGVSVAPDMLGANGPRRYFIAFQNPSELTGNGGFMGNWAELVTDDGRLELVRTGRVRELTQGGDPEGREIENEPEYVSIYGESNAQYWGNINFSPDHPTVSRIYAGLYPESGGAPVDGVIAMTPKAFAGFLEITGPVDVPGYPDQLTSENVERIMLHEQYLNFAEQPGADREEFLADAVEVLFDELTEGDLPGPSAIAEELTPAVEGGHLKMWSAHEQEEALFTRLGMDGDMHRSSADSFGAVTQNFNGNKIDWFLHRNIAYEASWNPTSGEVSGTVSAEISNQAPSSGLPPSIIGWGGDVSLGQTPVDDGENLMLVTMYATYPISAITLDGEPVGYTPDEELGHHTGRFYMFVPPGGTRKVVAEFAGAAEPGARYTVRPLRQPTINPDTIEIDLTVVGDWEVQSTGTGEVTDGSRVRRTADATERITLTVDVETAGPSTVLDRLRGLR